MELKPPALPFLVVDDPGPCRDFWVDVMGFTCTFEDRPEGVLDFVVLQGQRNPAAHGDPITLEYQRRAGLDPTLRERLGPDARSIVYTWVRGLDALTARITERAASAIVERRATHYGADELVVTDPAGHLFVFGERPVAPPASH
jgi:hypothetical protein